MLSTLLHLYISPLYRTPVDKRLLCLVSYCWASYCVGPRHTKGETGAITHRDIQRGRKERWGQRREEEMGLLREEKRRDGKGRDAQIGKEKKMKRRMNNEGTWRKRTQTREQDNTRLSIQEIHVVSNWPGLHTRITLENRCHGTCSSITQVSAELRTITSKLSSCYALMISSV